MTNVRSKDELREFVNKKNKVKYLFFWGHQKSTSETTKSCFSQWYTSEFEENGLAFKTAEHYMMYRKAVLFNDEDSAQKVLASSSPRQVKAFGRNVIGFDESAWRKHRFQIVVQANLLKFSQNKDLAKFLINTGDRVLVEASPVDKIWGIGLDQHDKACEDPNKWKGLNLLGFALMEVRDQLRLQIT